MTLQGQATPSGKNRVVRVGKSQYVELARESEDSIFTVLGEFGTGVATTHDVERDPLRRPRALHNQIPEPDRSVDNSTIWTADFSRAYYEDLLFSEKEGAVSVRSYYIEQSSNRYAVNGDVTLGQGARQRRELRLNYCGDIVCQDTWLFVGDSLDAWYASQVAAARAPPRSTPTSRRSTSGTATTTTATPTSTRPTATSTIFQAVHAGEGEDGWRHLRRGRDLVAPVVRLLRRHRDHRTGLQQGRRRAGRRLQVLGRRLHGRARERRRRRVRPRVRHDLGLPDLYDTSGNTGGAENSTAFWTLT